jgi:pimeloyl-ACP methyl ester carboxylesterase
LKPIAMVAELLRTRDIRLAREAFEQSETATRLASAAPDNLSSLRGFFNRPDSAALLGAIAKDGPGVTEGEARKITVPTLVIGTAADAVHPLDLAAALAAVLPAATLAEITSKSVDRASYVAECRAALAMFFKQAGR